MSRVDLDQARSPPAPLAGDESSSGACERIENHISSPAAVVDRAFDQRDRLLARVVGMGRGTRNRPDIPLVVGAAPRVVGTVAPAVEDGFVLASVVGLSLRGGLG